MRVLVEQRLGRHDLAVLAEAALGDLLVDPRLLERVELAVFGEPFKRGDFTPDVRRRRDARPDGGAVDDDRAGTALAESAPEPWALQAEVVAKDVEQRRRGFHVHGVRAAVYPQGDIAHRLSFLMSACIRIIPPT